MGTDVSPLHFTGKMHDNETGLDEFPARYYSSTQGRWYSPDWASAQIPVPYADLHNPQTLNLYDYVGSDPTNHADADGHQCLAHDTGCGEEQADEKKKEKDDAQANQGAEAQHDSDEPHGVYLDHENTNISPAGDTGETKIGFIEGTATHKGVTEGEAGLKGGGVDITLKNHEGKSSLELQGFTGEAGAKGQLNKKGLKVGGDAEAASL